MKGIPDKVILSELIIMIGIFFLLDAVDEKFWLNFFNFSLFPLPHEKKEEKETFFYVLCFLVLVVELFYRVLIKKFKTWSLCYEMT